MIAKVGILGNKTQPWQGQLDSPYNNIRQPHILQCTGQF